MHQTAPPTEDGGTKGSKAYVDADDKISLTRTVNLVQILKDSCLCQFSNPDITESLALLLMVFISID